MLPEDQSEEAELLWTRVFPYVEIRICTIFNNVTMYDYTYNMTIKLCTFGVFSSFNKEVVTEINYFNKLTVSIPINGIHHHHLQITATVVIHHQWFPLISNLFNHSQLFKVFTEIRAL